MSGRPTRLCPPRLRRARPRRTLRLPPVALQDVLPGVDEFPRVRYRVRVDRVRGHRHLPPNGSMHLGTAVRTRIALPVPPPYRPRAELRGGRTPAYWRRWYRFRLG